MATNSEVLDAVNSLREEMHVFMAEMKTPCTQVEQHQEFIHGNGKEGAKLRLEKIEAFVNSTKKVYWLIGGAVILDAAMRVYKAIYP